MEYDRCCSILGREKVLRKIIVEGCYQYHVTILFKNNASSGKSYDYNQVKDRATNIIAEILPALV